MSRPAVVFDRISKVYQLSHQKSETLKDRLTRTLFGRGRTESDAPKTEEFYALKDVSFEIQPGESVGIVGPNGSGKSTTLKILASVTQPTAGRFEINGKLGALIEVGAGFHPELSGRENVFLNGSILGMSKATIQRKFDSIVEFAEIEQFIDVPVKHYSSGMYVRLGFAIAIQNEPEIMLVDEILAVGDLAFKKKCFAKMEELKSGGRTFILVSHSMEHIQSMCSRALMLQKGVLVADGGPIDVTEKYHELHALESGVQPGGIGNFLIKAINLRGPHGEHVNTVQLGQAVDVRIDYHFKQPVANPTMSVILRTRGIRVYRSDTKTLGINFGVMEGKGQLLCRLPEIPFAPNEYDIEVIVRSGEGNDILVRRLASHLFSISRPRAPADLGCILPIDSGPGTLVYGRATWSVCEDQGTD